MSLVPLCRASTSISSCNEDELVRVTCGLRFSFVLEHGLATRWQKTEVATGKLTPCHSPAGGGMFKQHSIRNRQEQGGADSADTRPQIQIINLLPATICFAIYKFRFAPKSRYFHLFHFLATATSKHHSFGQNACCCAQLFVWLVESRKQETLFGLAIV